MISEILFWFFGLGAIISGFMVISSNNPMHSVFSLVLAFANTSILLLLLGVEFLALLFMIVYVGAIAILFLFVIMMLNIKLVELMDNATRYVPVGLIIGVVFLIEILIMRSEQNLGAGMPEYYGVGEEFTSAWIYNYTNIQALGHILYTEYFVLFIVSSLILFVSMIGAIVLTLGHEEGVRRQDLFAQITTDYQKTIVLKK